MSNEPKPKVAVQPSAQQRQETLDTLTGGKPVAEDSTTQPKSESTTPDPGITVPGVARVKQEAGAEDGTRSDDNQNQRDAGSDVLAR